MRSSSLMRQTWHWDVVPRRLGCIQTKASWARWRILLGRCCGVPSVVTASNSSSGVISLSFTNTKNGGLGVPATGGKSHYTFQHGVDELMAGQLGQDLKQFSKKHGDRAKILITGHSQGAGLAVLAHLTVLKEKVLSGYIGCVAIATPKVLDFEGSANGECALEDFNKTVRMGKPPAHAIQFVNQNDPIPHTPASDGTLPGGSIFPVLLSTETMTYLKEFENASKLMVYGPGVTYHFSRLSMWTRWTQNISHYYKAIKIPRGNETAYFGVFQYYNPIGMAMDMAHYHNLQSKMFRFQLRPESGYVAPIKELMLEMNKNAKKKEV
eukprot:PhM_4_TR461/c3_g3_i3/m.80137